MQAFFERLGACGQVLSCVRPLDCGGLPAAGPVWRYADRVHIGSASLNALRDQPGFPDPVSSTVCPYPSSVLPTSPTAPACRCPFRGQREPGSSPCSSLAPTCRHCEKISQPPAPFHPTPRGWAGPNLLATIVFEKYGQHQPLNRQRDRYAREGVDLSLSTLADQVGACTVALRPLHDLIAAHVLAAQRLHGDDTPVPVLVRGKTATGRAWVYVRDDAPFGGPDPPAALFHYSRDRSGDHPVEHLRSYTGILQADAYAGYNRLYAAGRSPGPVTEAACWSHSRRKFFELADIAASKRRGKNAPPISPVGAGGGEADRRAVRHRARDQRQAHRAAPRRTPAAGRAGAGRSQGLDAGRPPPRRASL